MTSTATISQYSQAAANLPDEALLGELVFFSITEADVNLAKARTDLAALGLSLNGLRESLRPVDAFRKATRVMNNHAFAPEDGVQMKVLVRAVGQDGDQAYRHIVMERVKTKTGQKRGLLYDASAEIIFTRGSKKNGEYEGYSLEITPKQVPGLTLNAEQQAWLDAALAQVRVDFSHWMEYIDSHAVRTYVREYLENELNGIGVKRSGGAYFVRQEHIATLHKLRDWVKSIGSDFHMVPLLDLVDQREMLLEAFENETIAEVERLSSEIMKILSDPNRTIRRGTYEEYVNQASELIAKTAEYSDMLDVKIERATSELTMFKMQTLQLAGRISGEEAQAPSPAMTQAPAIQAPVPTSTP